MVALAILSWVKVVTDLSRFKGRRHRLHLSLQEELKNFEALFSNAISFLPKLSSFLLLFLSMLPSPLIIQHYLVLIVHGFAVIPESIKLYKSYQEYCKLKSTGIVPCLICVFK